MKVTITFLSRTPMGDLHSEQIIERAVVISVGSEYLRVETLSEKYHFPTANILRIRESGDE